MPGYVPISKLLLQHVGATTMAALLYLGAGISRGTFCNNVMRQQRFQKSCLCLPEMEDVCDENGKPEIMASPFLWALFESNIEFDIKEQFPYWVDSNKPEINIVAPWGWYKAEDDADAIGYRPKVVINL